MTSQLEANIVAVERTKEYAEVANEVCVVSIMCIALIYSCAIGTSYYL